MSDTPETDSCPAERIKGLCGQLERERDEAREAFAIATSNCVAAQQRLREMEDKMERERNEARREAERWRDCFKTGMSMQPKAPSNVFPWENDKDLARRALDSE
jgi:hypothetical protein